MPYINYFLIVKRIVQNDTRRRHCSLTNLIPTNRTSLSWLSTTPSSNSSSESSFCPPFLWFLSSVQKSFNLLHIESVSCGLFPFISFHTKVDEELLTYKCVQLCILCTLTRVLPIGHLLCPQLWSVICVFDFHESLSP